MKSSALTGVLSCRPFDVPGMTSWRVRPNVIKDAGEAERVPFVRVTFKEGMTRRISFLLLLMKEKETDNGYLQRRKREAFVRHHRNYCAAVDFAGENRS